jgi:hypothetical protein
METVQLSLKLKVTTNPEHTIQRIVDEEGQGIRVFFKRSHRMSVFEVGMLYSVLVRSKLPYDYAKYHKCVAGEIFFENIANVTKFVVEKNIIETEFEREVS